MADAKCEQCKGIILGASRQISGKAYHPKCFICTGCSKLLGEHDWKENNGWPWCTTGSNCFENGKSSKFTITEGSKEPEWVRDQAAKAKEVSNSIGTLGSISLQSGGGFTVDPRTGEKKPANRAAPNKP